MSTDISGGSIAVISNSAPASVNIVRSLGRRGIRTIVASEDERSPAFSSKYCDERVSLPDPTTDLGAYRDVLLDIAARPSVRTITPVREADVYVLSKHRSAFAEHVSPVWPTMESLSTVHDRLDLIAAADRAGVDYPKTELLTDVDDWDRRLISKGRFSILTDHYVDDVPEGESRPIPKTEYIEPGEKPDIDRLVDRMGHVPIVQSYVPGTEYTVRALCDDGEVLFSTQKALRRGYKYPRGPSVYHEAVDIPELGEATRALLSALDWHGVASVGFIREDGTGAPKLLEINPRFWSSLPCDIHAGVDYPLYYWEFANGHDEGFEPPYEPETASHFLRGELIHLHSVATETYPFVEKPSLPKTVASMAKSMATQRNFDYYSSDDPRPFARDVLNHVSPF